MLRNGWNRAAGDSRGTIKEIEKTRIALSDCNSSGQGRNRTTDTRIFSPLLYQLSYLAVSRRLYRRTLSRPPRSLLSGTSAAFAAATKSSGGVALVPRQIDPQLLQLAIEVRALQPRL